MSLRPWVTIPNSREIVHENAWYSVYRERFVLPSGKEGVYHVVDTAPTVVVIPFLPNGKMRLLEQWRYILREITLEFAGGGTRHGERVDTPRKAAERELAEEAHLVGELEEIGSFFPCHKISSERCHVFIARNCSEHILPAEDTEEFIFRDLTPEEFNKEVAQGRVLDGMMLAAWLLYQSYANI